MWLLALLPAALVWWMLLRRSDASRAWRAWVDPALLEALLVQGDQRRRLWRPVHVLGLLWLLGLLALSGPSWRQEPSPFAEDKAALVIVVKVTPSMLDSDVAPNRLKRAAQKVSDLLELRGGARNSLVAYAGTAHLVMPLTSDASVIRTFSAELAPDLMPEKGDDASAALALAGRQLERSDQPGAILFVTDDLTAAANEAIDAHRQRGGAPVHVLAVASAVPDPLKQAARTGGGLCVAVRPDSSDVEKLAKAVQETARAPEAAGLGSRWHDAGYWLVPLLALLGALWFRRGWVALGV
jgi:Ca-activated chloride channel family protein